MSPFPHQGPLRPEEVTGRDELLDDLADRVRSHRVTALVGPRRFGKTSVLGRLAADCSGMATVWVDLYEVSSIADVIVRFDDALVATTGPFADQTRAAAAAMDLGLGALRSELAGPPRTRPDPAVLLRSLLGVLVAAATDQPTLLIIDEFSSIIGVPVASAALRTALQHHYRDLGMVVAGSHPSEMRALFASPSEAFDGQGDLLTIEPLSRRAIHDVVVTGFASTGRRAGHIANRIAAFTGGHPRRTMQLADACWRRTREGATADADGWTKALMATRRAEAEWMERFYSSFKGGERGVLRMVARSGTVYGTDARLLDISAGTATHARNALIDRGELIARPGNLSVVDPLFADWLRRRFPI